MELIKFKTKKINYRYVMLIAAIAVPVLLLTELLFAGILIMMVCENCFSKVFILMQGVFALSNILNFVIFCFLAGNIVVLWNRFCVANYKEECKKARRVDIAIQKKRKVAAKRARQSVKANSNRIVRN